MYSAGSQLSLQSSNLASASLSIVARPIPSPPMTPARQQQPQAAPSAAVSVAGSSSLAVRGRNRELQLLNIELQLLQEELNLLETIPPASKACEELVTLIESRADPFFPSSDGIVPQSWPHDRPVKASRCCWRF